MDDVVSDFFFKRLLRTSYEFREFRHQAVQVVDLGGLAARKVLRRGRALRGHGLRQALHGLQPGLGQHGGVVRGQGGELAADLGGVDVPFYRAGAEVMAEVIGFHLNRGVLAAAPRPAELTVAEVLDGARTVAVLEGVNDHENLGSIFRNAAGLGVDAVLFGTGCADPLYRRAVRVSMGHALLVPYAWAPAWPAELDTLRDNGFRVLAMTPNPAAPTLASAMAELGDAKIAMMVGAEGPGLKEHTMRSSDVRVRIPMSRGTDSLNVATAAALAFYERDRLAP